MPRALRLSLVHQAVLLLVAAVLLAVTALGAAVAWNLRSGFSDYLRLQDQAWLNRFTSLAAQAVAHQGLAAIDARSGRLRALLDAADGWGEPDPAMAAEDPPRDGHEGHDGHDGHDDEAAPGRPPPPPRGERPPPQRDNDRPPRAGTPRNGDRLVLVAADGRMLFGRCTWLGEAPLQRPIVVAGQTMAVARLAGGVAAPLGLGALDANFLARQYRGILLTAAGLMLLAGASAVFIGRRWLRPVQAARQAAHRITLGHLEHGLRSVTGQHPDELPRQRRLGCRGADGCGADRGQLELQRQGAQQRDAAGAGDLGDLGAADGAGLSTGRQRALRGGAVGEGAQARRHSPAGQGGAGLGRELGLQGLDQALGRTGAQQVQGGGNGIVFRVVMGIIKCCRAMGGWRR